MTRIHPEDIGAEITTMHLFIVLHYCELHNDRPKTAETSAIRVS
jgi:hypothetical protein